MPPSPNVCFHAFLEVSALVARTALIRGVDQMTRQVRVIQQVSKVRAMPTALHLRSQSREEVPPDNELRVVESLL